MLIPAGVLVPIENAALVREALAHEVRSGRVALTANVIALMTELDVAANLSEATPSGNGQLTVSLELVTVDAMAAEAGVTPRAIRARIRSGRLNGKKIGGRWFIPQEQP